MKRNLGAPLRRVLDGCDGGYFPQGKRDGKGGAAAFAFAAGFNDSAVQFNKMPGDRESEAKTACCAAAHCFGLPEAIEDVWKELRADAFSSVAHGELGLA